MHIAQPAIEVRGAHLIFAIAAGDEHALRQLMAISRPRLFRVALTITRNASLAEEAVQDTFLQVWKVAATFDAARSSASAWLKQLARCRAVDVVRRNARFEHQELADDDDDSEAGSEPLFAPHVNAADVQLDARRLGRAFSELQPVGRQLLHLAYQNGLSHAEISAHTRLPLGTVKSGLRRAVQQLRSQLTPQGRLRGERIGWPAGL
ncbi:MAG TPA: sigma-70 family RNA polymerase sigma factor [Ideonella sp.]|nr:sigma-70 family RNA polymerase sigma factor [Ideonella sp.]